jgi:exodeoxyribonuclease VII small subunit
MQAEMKYEEAVVQLEAIVRKMENDEFDIDELTEQLKNAQQLLKLCKDKLTKTETEVKNLLQNVAEE